MCYHRFPPNRARKQRETKPTITVAGASVYCRNQTSGSEICRFDRQSSKIQTGEFFLNFPNIIKHTDESTESFPRRTDQRHGNPCCANKYVVLVKTEKCIFLSTYCFLFIVCRPDSRLKSSRSTCFSVFSDIRAQYMPISR